MKASATFAALLMIAGAAFAQETPKPDYSKEAVQEFVMRIEVEEPEARPYDPFSLPFNAFGTTWSLSLPGVMMPLSGTQMGVTQQLPDPFSLSRTVIATGPRAIARYRREVSRELKKINKRLNATVDVKTR